MKKNQVMRTATQKRKVKKELALDVTKFQEHLESSEVEDLVNEDSDGADDAGINSTPSFFLNGEAINPKTYEEYREVIRQAIEA